MITSRAIKDLHPHVMVLANAFLNECAHDPWLLAQGVNLIVTCTYRDFSAQEALYAQGRTEAGRKVTNARAGQSWHNFGCAIDVLPLRHGKPVWGTRGNGIDNDPTDDAIDDLELWQRIGKIGESHGLEWAGRWTGFREFAHFQHTGGLSLAQAMAGMRP